MTELKTLKEIERREIDFKHNYDYSLDEDGIFVSDLKQEAINWIKSFRTGELTTHINEYGIHHKIDWIKHFFNIKESDLE